MRNCAVRAPSNLTALWKAPVRWVTLHGLCHAKPRDNFTRVKVQLPDGNWLELEDGATGADAAKAIGEGLARAALAVKQNGDVKDLSAPLEDGQRIDILTAKSDEDEALKLIRHDTAHVLAEAVLDLYPGVKI